MRHFTPRKLAFSVWVDHMPFSYDLVAEMRPRKFVELGTHNGLSYFTMCQSIRDHDIDCTAFAVDTWEGDDHTGAYDNSIWGDVSNYNRETYPAFSYLLRMLFEDAVSHFADGSIDLLHIDGLHTYDAVANDFETWRSKLTPGAIVLFHDIESRMSDYGVWRFWDEIKSDYDTFSFTHGFGLGVLRMPGEPDRKQGALEELLFSSSQEQAADIRALYAHVARLVMLESRVASGGLPAYVKVDKTGDSNISG